MPRHRSLLPVGLGCLALFLAVNLAASQDAAQPVTLVVKVNPADVKVEVDGTATRQTGPVRRFVSPPLQTGKTYYYVIASVQEPNNYTKIIRKRRVPVQAGKEIEIDLTREDPAQKDEVVVRYVPTPQEVVDAMLKMASVGKDDVVYDLGCGDGRLVITAVKKYGATRGIGIDIDPDRIKDSNENAGKEMVKDRVEFRQEDVLKLKDLPGATVVTLYMGEELNLRLRPFLEKTLKPGSRIVSHRFLLGDWKPEKTISITDSDGVDYDLHLWTVGKK